MVLFVIISFVILLSVFANKMTIGAVPYRDLNDQVTARIIRADGSVTDYKNMALANMDPQDCIIFTVPIPEQDGDTSNALVFYQYHSEIRVYFEDRQIYEYGSALTRQDKMYGNEMIAVSIPEEAYGKELKVEAIQMEGDSSSHFTSFRLMRMEDARLYPLIGNALTFLLFALMLLLSLTTFVIYVIVAVFSQNKLPLDLLMLTLFSYLMSMWQLSSRRLLYIMVANRNVSAVTEYYALFLAPIPFFAYMSLSKQHKHPRNVYRLFCLGSILLNGFMIGMRFFRGTHLIAFERVNYAFVFTTIGITAVMEIVKSFHSRKERDDTLHAGIIVAMILIVVQIILLILKNYLINEFWIRLLQSMDLAAVAIVFYMFSLYFDAGQEAVRALRQRAMEEQTRRMAYTDVLTGIPNRLSLDKNLASLKKEKMYSMIFMDADGLKAVNDRLGHEYGDALIRLVGTAIRESFPEGPGFYGRWGGDEFIACVRDHEAAEDFVRKLEKRVAELSEEQPFTTSVSWGIADRESDTMTPDEVKHLADQRMYRQKEENHRTRKDLTGPGASVGTQ